MILGSRKVSIQMNLQNDQLYVNCTSRFGLPLGRIYLKITLFNDFLEESQTYQTTFLVGEKKISFPIDSNPLHIGNYHIKQISCKLTDILGIFSKKIKKNSSMEIYQSPPRIHLQLNNLFEMIQENQDNKSEDYDIRDYRIGDNLRNIHYKISYKLSKYMVKEKVKETKNNLSLFLDLSGNEQDCLQVFSLFEEFVHYLQIYNEKVEVYWSSNQQLFQKSISTINEIPELFKEILSMPKMKQVQAVKATWILTPSGLEGGETNGN